MSNFGFSVKLIESGAVKLLHLNWAVIVLLCAIAGLGFLMLYSVAGGSMTPWAEPQMRRFALGMCVLFTVAMVPIWFLRNIAGVAYAISVLLLISVEFYGTTGMGARRWIDLGFFSLQPSELTKITLIMFLASYYDWLDIGKTSRPQWVILPILIIALPTFLVLRQPDLGTSLLLALGGSGVMFLAGVSWIYFAGVIGAAAGIVVAVFKSRSTDWQLLKDYQFRRIDTFLDPASDPLGAGYHITQSKIALGSGGWTGRGYMQGTQSQLNFLPEKQTDFIFTTLAEEFGFIGGISLLSFYVLVVFFCFVSAMTNRDRFASLLTYGIALTFFLFFALNMSMVMGLAPVVGVSLPLVSYGGSAMMVLLFGFGMMQSAHVQRSR